MNSYYILSLIHIFGRKHNDNIIGSLHIGIQVVASGNDSHTPVSYTHLDVYKRQVVLRVAVMPEVLMYHVLDIEL